MKAIQKAQLQNEEKYRLLFQSMPVGVLIQDAVGRITQANPAAVSIFGLPDRTESDHAISLETPGRFIRTDGSILPIEERPDIVALSTGKPVNNFIMGICLPGHPATTWVNISSIPQFLPDSQHAHEVFTTVEDITVRFNAEKALRTSEERYKRLSKDLEQRVIERTAEIETTRQRLMLAAQASNLGIWEWHVETNRLIWDETILKLYGLKRDQFDGTFSSLYSVLHPDDVMAVEKAMQDGLAGKDITAIEYRIVQPNGATRHIRAHGLFLRDSTGQTHDVIGTVMDVTDARQVEGLLRQANEEMETALRMKDEFLANMSHELRTPLNAILGISESLQDEIMGPLNDKQRRYVQVVNESGHHLLELINDILDLSKIEAGRLKMEYRHFDIQQLCQSSLRMVAQMAQKKALSVSFKNDERASTFYADPRRIKQVLVNLLSNAVKFTSNGGQIGLELRAEPKASLLVLVVWDTGIGIRAKDTPRLFQPFVQLDAGLDREHSGTGLGLALAAQIIRHHGGRMELQSTEGQGSRFSVVLPWHTDAPEQVDVNTTPLPEASEASAGTILLIEDTDSTILPVRDYLTYRGFQVIVARDGLSGIESTHRHRPDLILADVQIPGMDIFEVVRQIRDAPDLAHTPIIALTALAMAGDRERCLAAGMNDYISKPVRMSELLAVLTTHLQRTPENQ